MSSALIGDRWNLCIARALRLGIALMAAGSYPTASQDRRGQEFRDCAECPVMVVIPAGPFTMGEPEAESQNGRRGWGGPPVPILFDRPFAIAKYETTRSQFEAFVRAERHHVQGPCPAMWPAAFPGAALPTWRDPAWPNGNPSVGDDPVVCVGFTDAAAYVAWLNSKAPAGRAYGLPSEAQFEYAARGGTTTPYPWPGGMNRACAFANIADARFKATGTALPTIDCDDGHAFVAPVGSFPANGFGVHDLLGNVWEWTTDCGSANDLRTYPRDGSPVSAGAGDCGQRTTRGGGFVSNDWWMRVTARGGGHDAAAFFNPATGFRVVAALR
jgi:formylglycine-generating enzyme required for sulfatase activity